MKRLEDFIKEHVMEATIDKKQVTFDFTGIDNAEETLKSLGELDCATVEDNKVTIELTCDNCGGKCVTTAQDILQQAIQTERGGTKSSNNEQYAQKVASLERKLAEFNDALDEIENPDDDDDKSDDEDDKSKEGE